MHESSEKENSNNSDPYVFGELIAQGDRGLSISQSLSNESGSSEKFVENGTQWCPRCWEERLSWVYFIETHNSRFVKIGYSKNPEQRCKTLASSERVKLRLMGCFPGGVKTEAWIHHKFAEFRLGGEWFLNSPKIKDFVLAIWLSSSPYDVPMISMRRFDMHRRIAEDLGPVREWIKKHRGTMSRIARSVQPQVSPQFVRQVVWGEVPVDSDHRVYRELKEAGWPGCK